MNSKKMKTQIETDWLSSATSDDRTFLRIFGICIEWDRSFCSIIPFTPSLVISWSAKRYFDREISFIWNGLPYPMLGMGFRIGINKVEWAIYPAEWLPDAWAEKIFDLTLRP